jgi:hypothetical protein
MLPGTWAYVSAGAFGRAIIVSFSLLFCCIVNSTHIWATLLSFNYCFKSALIFSDTESEKKRVRTGLGLLLSYSLSIWKMSMCS